MRIAVFTDVHGNLPALKAALATTPSRAALKSYGPNHEAPDVQSRIRYVNPGSLGCFRVPVARFVTVDLDGCGSYTLAPSRVHYLAAWLAASVHAGVGKIADGSPLPV